ncbi:MAG: OmpA family protein [Bacteroidetes bacterium]|nr:OmpA family protein [Bacteroidota bacterium]
MSGNLKKAESWYKKAISAAYYDPICIYQLANIQRNNNKFEEALENYARYLAEVPDDEQAIQEVEGCKRAVSWIENPTQWQIRNMSEINSKFNDFASSYMEKRFKNVIFTSAREESMGKKKDGWTGQKFTDLYSSKRDKKGKWSKALPVEGPINTEFNEGATSFNKSYNTVFYTLCKKIKKRQMGCEIYWAKKKGKGFGKPELIPLSTDTFTCGHPSMASDDVTLYFASNKPGGFGGNDIWVAKYNKKAMKWDRPKNLGPTINTSGNEMFPFMRADGTLYFSSDKHLGMGGLDIFKATKTGSRWSTPENLKYPLNSPADDFAIVFKTNLEEGMLTSNRVDGKGRDDIYEFLWQIYAIRLQGYVYDLETKDTLPGSLVTLTKPDGTAAIDTADNLGYYSFDLEQNMGYDVEGSRPKFLNDLAEIGTYEIRSDTTIDQDLYLQNTVKPIVLPNILYDLAKWNLRPESKKSLDGLVETLNDNPNITIELSSHTDTRATDKYNKTLSHKRAKTAVDYLIEKNIEKERLKPMGYGEEKARELQEDIGSFKKGDKFTDGFIRKLESEELKEEAHQLNRRTMFKVLRTNFVSKRIVKEEEEEEIEEADADDDE